ncbi:MAG: hypothetical protein LUB61_01365 [Eggerthellaceae bacterium]|nr:hypothetical protein [Eggerthellaceae bacterium]
MLQKDYLMSMILALCKAIVRSKERSDPGNDDPLGAAENLEDALAAATDLDADLLLSLEPESMVSLLEVSATDSRVAGYMARSLILAGHYRKRAGQDELAELRVAQGRALAAAYDDEIPDLPIDEMGFELLFPDGLVDMTDENLEEY